MREIHVDFTGEKPLDVPWPEEIEEVRKELQGLEDIDLVQLFQEISKIRLAVVKAGRKRAQEGPTPLSEEKGVRFLTTAINELRRLTPEVTNMKERIEESVREDFMLQLFPIIDSFDRFFASVREVSDPKLEKWVEGIRGVYNSVLVLLRNNNVKEIPTKGTFNPKYQAAVGTEIRNELPPGTILSVERRGFVIGSKILRTPELIISKRDDIVE